jgi:hypothetical protein
VGSGGSCLNNVGGKVADKIAFQSNYRFSIACENAVHPGYITEKILEAYQSGCIPIYFGSESIAMDFNPSTFIHVRDFGSTAALLDHVRRVDTDPDLYRSYFQEPIFSSAWQTAFSDPEEAFFRSVVRHICPDLL